jgi:transcriptional regulator with XRE-family HTH domain
MKHTNDAARGFEVRNLSDLSGALLKLRQLRGLEQADMKMRIGMSQQQYSNIEGGGNTTIQTLLRVLEGLDAELVVMPKTKSATGSIGWFEGAKYLFPDIEHEKPKSPVGDEFSHLRDDD